MVGSPIDPERLKQLSQHQRYYMHGGNLIVLAGHTLFRFHGEVLTTESRRFHDDLYPLVDGLYRGGNSDGTALIVDCTAEQFETFIQIWYDPYDVFKFNLQQWTTILHLAHQWGFPRAKKLAVNAISRVPASTLSTVARIVLYQMYDLGTELLLPLYTELVSRDIPLSFEECNTLGSETTFLIWSGRERVRAVGGDGSKSPVPKDLEQEDIKKTIAGLINPKSQNGSANGNANADAGNTKVDSGNSKGKNKPGGSTPPAPPPPALRRIRAQPLGRLETDMPILGTPRRTSPTNNPVEAESGVANEEDAQQGSKALIEAKTSGAVESGNGEGVSGSTSKPGSSDSAMPSPIVASRDDILPSCDVPPFPGTWY